MIIIGEQNFTPGNLHWMTSKYHIPMPGETTTVRFLNDTYTLPSCKGMALSIEKQSITETKPIKMKEVFKSLPWFCSVEGPKYVTTPWTATSIFNINQCASYIAKDSRRGRGNYILCNSEKDLERLDRWDLGVNMYTVIETANVASREAVVLYSGNHATDKPFAMHENKLYVHMNYLKLMRKIKLP